MISGKTHNATSFAEAFHMVFKVVLNKNQKDMPPTRFVRSVKKQINVAMYNMGTATKRKFEEMDAGAENGQRIKWRRDGVAGESVPIMMPS